jgi:hypothetical protein
MTQDDPISAVGRPTEPGLESTLLAGSLGVVSLPEVLDVFAGWPVTVLSTEDWRQGPENLHPLILNNGGGPLAAVFTSPDRIDASFRQMAPFPIILRGSLIARGLSQGVGIVINPGSRPTLELSPEGTASVGVREPRIDAQAPGSRELTALEQTIVSVLSAETDRSELIAQVIETNFYIPSVTEPGSEETVSLPAASDGAIAVFTDPGFIRDTLSERAPFVLRAQASELPAILGTPVDLVVNPGTGISTRIPAEALL